MANFFAQSEALLKGTCDEAIENAYRCFEGNKPSNAILISKLTPKNLGSLIALYNPFNAFQVSAEFEQMHVNYKDDRFPESSEWIPAIYLGLAYHTGNIAFGMRYNVLFNSTNRSIYSSAFTPVFRVYF